MKRCVTLLLLALLAVTSCGTASQFASEQSFYDGIYYRPAQVREVRILSEEDFVAIAAHKIQNEKAAKDTTLLIVAPKANVNIIFGLGWGFGWNWGFGPRFGWYGSWGWDPWFYPWDPWYYGWDPWYIGWDPWYYPWGPRPWMYPYGPYPYWHPFGPYPYGPGPIIVNPTIPHGPDPRPLTVGGVGSARSGGMGTVTRGRTPGSGSGYNSYNRSGGSNINPLSPSFRSGQGAGTGAAKSFRVTPQHSQSGTIQRGGGSSRTYGNGPSRSTSGRSNSSVNRSSSPSYSGGSRSVGGGGGGASYGGGGGMGGGSRGGGMGGGGRR